MIFLPLHQARNKEIEARASTKKQGQAGKFRYIAKISPIAKLSVPLF